MVMGAWAAKSEWPARTVLLAIEATTEDCRMGGRPTGQSLDCVNHFARADPTA